MKGGIGTQEKQETKAKEQRKKEKKEEKRITQIFSMCP